MDSSMLLWSVLFGGIGIGFFSYGKKQRKIVPLLTGIALFGYPYLVSSSLMMVVIGVILISLPYFIKI